MYVEERFKLKNYIIDELRREPVNFGYPESGFGEYIYYKHYSRQIRDDDWDEVLGQEDFHDTTIRVIEGVMSIRKDHYVRNRIKWDEDYWQEFARGMALSMIRMEWLPPGRGLWAMGSPQVYERGSMALYNCAFSLVGSKDGWVEDICWIMDSLMHGVGVGARPLNVGLSLTPPRRIETYIVPDTREGWVESVRRTLNAFAQPDGVLPELDVSQVRKKNEPIKTFGGIASGPDPLLDLCASVTDFCYRYINEPEYDVIRFFSDIVNCVGVCVVSGNVRRSAEILLGDVHDSVFMDLKNYERFPYRADFGWMSNNSVLLSRSEDFEELDQIAMANRNGHDVGYLNLVNFTQGRVGRDDDVPMDMAVGINPCGEIPLEHREVCNLAETLPTRCVDENVWYDACKYATFYCSTVSLLPTHQPTTNAVVARNRRIGVSIVDFTGWKDQEGVSSVIRYLREGYRVVRHTNAQLADEAGVPRSIRLTTVKPGGTVPKMAGRTAGASHPTFKYTLMRVQVEKNHPVVKLLQDAGVPYEQSVYDKNNYVFEWPVEQGPAEPAGEVSIWEQAFNIVLLQREWADNAVSNTLYFRPQKQLVGIINVDEVSMYDQGELVREGDKYKVYRSDPGHEEGQLEAVLAHIAPYVKSVSLLPHSDKGIFPQMPQEGITKESYDARLESIRKIDWSQFEGSDGQDEKFCTGEACEV